MLHYEGNAGQPSTKWICVMYGTFQTYMCFTYTNNGIEIYLGFKPPVKFLSNVCKIDYGSLGSGPLVPNSQIQLSQYFSQHTRSILHNANKYCIGHIVIHEKGREKHNEFLR